MMMKEEQKASLKLIRVYEEDRDLIDKIGKRKEYQSDIFHRIIQDYVKRHPEELD
jgi:hypothetical protein